MHLTRSTPGAKAPGAPPTPPPATTAAASPVPAATPIPGSVLACRRGPVLDLHALAGTEARDMFKMPEEAWQALATDTRQPPVSEVWLPQATRRKHLAQAIRGLNLLTELRQLHLAAPLGSPKVPLQGLQHPGGQLTVTLTLPESGGRTIALPTRLTLRTTTQVPGLATGKHRVQVVAPGQRPPEPPRTLHDWPYQRQLDPAVALANGGGMPILSLTRDRATQLGLYRLIRQALLEAGATRATPASDDAGRAGPLARAWRALHDDPADLAALLAGLNYALNRSVEPRARSAPGERHRFTYDFARTQESIDQHVGALIEQATTRLLTQAPAALVNPESPGELLEEQLVQLREGEARFLLICGSAHSVALLLRRRQAGEASVVCYDPRMPATHVRMVTADHAALRQLNLIRLLLPGSADYYFGAARPRVVGLYDLRQLLPARAQSLPPVARTRMVGFTSAHQARPQFLEMGMRLGPVSAVHLGLRTMDARADLIPLAELATRMTGQPGQEPLLLEAIRHDRIHQAAAYLLGVLKAQAFARRPQLRAKILRAAFREAPPRDAPHRTTLHRVTALRADARMSGLAHPETHAAPIAVPLATALSVALQSSPQAAGLLVRLLTAHPRAVPPHLQRILLLEADAQGVPLLHRLMARRDSTDPRPAPAPPLQAAAVFAYAYEVAASTSLSAAVKQELLLAAHQGETAMMAGIRNGKAAAAAALACAMYEAPMPLANRATLAAALRAPLMALPVALDLSDPGAQDWAARLLQSLGRPGTEAALSAHLQRTWHHLEAAPRWTLRPAIVALLEARRLHVCGTLHEDADFERAGLRPWRADDSQMLIICAADIALQELEAWRLAPPTRPLDALPSGPGPVYLLPADRLSPLASPPPAPAGDSKSPRR